MLYSRVFWHVKIFDNQNVLFYGPHINLPDNNPIMKIQIMIQSPDNVIIYRNGTEQRILDILNMNRLPQQCYVIFSIDNYPILIILLTTHSLQLKILRNSHFLSDFQSEMDGF